MEIVFRYHSRNSSWIIFNVRTVKNKIVIKFNRKNRTNQFFMKVCSPCILFVFAISWTLSKSWELFTENVKPNSNYRNPHEKNFDRGSYTFIGQNGICGCFSLCPLLFPHTIFYDLQIKQTGQPNRTANLQFISKTKKSSPQPMLWMESAERENNVERTIEKSAFIAFAAHAP